jgi:hypothetical protein
MQCRLLVEAKLKLVARYTIYESRAFSLQEWTDERLTWSQHEHNNMSEVIVEAKGIWRPEFAVING